MLPEELKKIIDRADYVEYDFHITAINGIAGDMEVAFRISDTEGSDEQVPVLMRVAGCKGFFIAPHDGSGYGALETEHPLLWQYQDTQCELYISGITTLIKEVAFDLFQIHYSLFKNYIPFHPKDILRPLTNGYGFFERGAKRLLTMYASKLYEYGIETSIIAESAPSEQTAALQLLFLGSSYFIGAHFEFEERPVA